MKIEEILIVIIAFVIGYVLNMILRPNHIIKRDKISHDIHVQNNNSNLGTNCKGYCLNNKNHPGALTQHYFNNIDDCKTECQKNNKCKGFDYNTESNNNENNCFLKTQECKDFDPGNSKFINSNVACWAPKQQYPCIPSSKNYDEKKCIDYCGSDLSNSNPCCLDLTNETSRQKTNDSLNSNTCKSYCKSKNGKNDNEYCK
tara:strand:+ start:101 stop:703 length:603 start_codon:yes stop_codon:yes gene_type:complete